MGDVPPEDEDRGAGAEIGGDRQQAAGILGPEGVARLHIGADIGASEAIDHLLRVADQEERARPDAEGLVVSAHGSSSDCNPALFSVSFSARMRAPMSVTPPTGQGTTMRTGVLG